MKFRSQRTSHVEPSAASTTVTGSVGERLQAGTKDTPVLDRPTPLRRFHDIYIYIQLYSLNGSNIKTTNNLTKHNK